MSKTSVESNGDCRLLRFLCMKLQIDYLMAVLSFDHELLKGDISGDLPAPQISNHHSNMHFSGLFASLSIVIVVIYDSPISTFF